LPGRPDASRAAPKTAARMFARDYIACPGIMEAQESRPFSGALLG